VRNAESFHGNNAVDSFGHIRQVVLVPAPELRGHPAAVADLVQGLAYLGPVDISIQKISPLISLAFEVLQVNFHEPFTQRSNPMLGMPVNNDVTHIEIRLYPATL